MPKPTFLKLPKAKRRRFLRAALKEFAAHDYDAASVSRVVASLGIAKGSLYQYFDGKQELFLHLIDVAVEAMMKSLQDQQIDPDADTFTLLRAQMSATVEASRRFPLESKLLQRAFTVEVPFSDEIASRSRQTGDAHMLALVKRGRARGELRSDVEPRLQAFLLRTLAAGVGPYLEENAIRRTVPEGAELERTFDQLVSALRDGLGARASGKR
jgi:AcrR family transcriptional regulator